MHLSVARRPWSPPRAALLAVLAPGVATGIGLAAGLDERPGATGLYLIAILLVTYAGGLWSGLAAAGLSFLGLLWFFVSPTHEFDFGWAAVSSLLVFLAGTVIVAAVLERESRARNRAQRAFDALSEAERRLELTFEETETGVWERDIARDEVVWSPNLGPIFGLARGEKPASYAEFARFVHPEDASRVAEVERAVLDGQERGEIEFRIVRPDGEVRWVSTEATVERDSEGRALRVLGLTRDVSERKRREAAEQLLGAVNAIGARALSVTDRLAALHELVVPALADRCSFSLLPGDGRAATPARVGAERGNTPHPLADEVLRTGEPRVVQRDEGSTLLARLEGLREPLGVMILATEAPRRLDRRDLAAAQELARRAGIAVENARLHEAELAARTAAEAASDLTARLQRVTAALATAATPKQIAEALVSAGTPAFEGSAAWVAYLSEDRTNLTRVADRGWSPEIREAFASIPVEASHPISDVVRIGESVWLGSADELAGRYPSLAGVYRSTGYEALAAVPIPTADGIGGVLLLSRADRAEFTPVDRSFLLALASQAGQALERARLYEDERAARARALLATRRVRRLQQLTAALADALTSREVAGVVTSEAAATFGAPCSAVQVLDESGSVLELADATGFAPELVERARRMPADSPYPTADAIHSRAVVAYPSAEAVLREFPAAAEVLGPIEAIALVPLVASERTVGVLTIAYTDPRPLDPEDEDLLLTFGRQAGQALERARLFEEERRLREGLERVLTLATELQAASGSIDVARGVCRAARTLLQSEIAQIWDVEAENVRVVWREPSVVPDTQGSTMPRTDFPGLDAAIQQSRPMFVRDTQESIRGKARDQATTYDIHSSLRIPISIAGRPDRLLILQWHRVVDPPDATSLAVIQRFAEQAALAIEQAERLEAEEAAARSAVRVRGLQEVTAALAAAASKEEIGRIILDYATSTLGAAAGGVGLVSEADETEIEIVSFSGYGPEVLERFRRFRIDSGVPIADAVRSGETIVLDSTEQRDERYPEVADVRPLSTGPAVTVPLLLADRAIGAIGLRFGARLAPDASDIEFLESLGRLAAQAFERATLYEREHSIAETLQRSVIPESIPAIEGALVAARYLPGSTGLHVGGDWYDVLRLAGDDVAVAVGDVVGKGLEAASTMAQLRNGLRAYALEALEPAAVVERLNRLADIAGAQFATLFYAVLDTRTGECRYASAGHPPALLVPDGAAPVFLEGASSLPLGVTPDTRYTQASVQLPLGATLVLYTDGLVETRGSDLGAELEHLRSEAEQGPHGLETFLDHLLERMLGGERHDDVALLAIRPVPDPSVALRMQLPATSASLAEIRPTVLAWLGAQGATPAEAHDLCLACWEACANALEHASEPRRTQFEVSGEIHDSSVTLIVRDHGTWRPPRPSTGRGLGLRLIEGLVDALVVAPSPDGTRVTMTRRLRSRVSA